MSLGYLWWACISLKGYCHGLTFAEFRSAKHILQQWRPTNTGPVFKKNYNASVMKLKKSAIIVIPPGAQDPNLKKSAWFFQVLPPWQCPFNVRFNSTSTAVTIPPLSRATPRTSSGPGLGNRLKQSCPGGTRVGKIKSNLSLSLWSTLLLGLHSVKKIANFLGKNSRICNWLVRQEYLSKLKAVV